jgi:hypothetical protein
MIEKKQLLACNKETCCGYTLVRKGCPNASLEQRIQCPVCTSSLCSSLLLVNLFVGSTSSPFLTKTLSSLKLTSLINKILWDLRQNSWSI